MSPSAFFIGDCFFSFIVRKLNNFSFYSYYLYISIMDTFKQKVLEVVKKIPRGQVLSYKEVAHRAGRPLAYRAVGNIMGQNHDPKVPCHRVIRSDGKIGGYRSGTGFKRELLKKEGAII